MKNLSNLYKGMLAPEQVLSELWRLQDALDSTGGNGPGRITVFDWDIEYAYGPALPVFVEQLIARRFDDFTPDNDRPVILDCGANIGLSVLNYKRQFPNAQIICFEADPFFVPFLRANLERNGAGDVQIVEAAVWVRNGEERWLCEGSNGSRIVGEDKAEQDTVVVRTICLADYLGSDVDLLKLDIEGAEYEVVGSLLGKLSKVKNLVVECHLTQKTMRAFSSLLEILVCEGFRIGINQFGSWRDLTRQPAVPLNHFEQYFTVSAWHSPIEDDPGHTSLSPNADYHLMRRCSSLERQLVDTQDALQFAQDELKSAKSDLIIYEEFGRPFYFILKWLHKRIHARSG